MSGCSRSCMSASSAERSIQSKLIYESKKLVMRRALASEVNVLAHMLNEISNQDRRARDFTLGVLREAIRETIACFPVYRTYIDERAHVSDSDRKYIQQAIACAKQKNGTLGAGGLRLSAEHSAARGHGNDGDVSTAIAGSCISR